jgi:hypothetical protein
MHKLLPILAFPLLLSACTEKMITVPDLGVGNRRVLVEELTGVGCTNCPDGARDLAALQASYGKENVVVVSIHSGVFSTPLANSQYDFRTAEADALADYLGQPLGYPAAAIDRRKLPNAISLYVVRSQWAGTIQQELAGDYGIGVFAVPEFDPVTRRLDIEINVVIDQALPGDHRLTVLITQDSIVDAQIDNGPNVPNYVHRHVLRDVVSQPDGDALPALGNGAQVTQTYSVTLPAEWDEQHISIVAYVHRGGDPDKEVLQVVEEHLFE